MNGNKIIETNYYYNRLLIRVEIKNCCSPVDANPCRQSSESGALSLSSAAQHIDFHSSRRIYVVLVAHSIALSLHYLLFYGGNVRIAALDLWRHSYLNIFLASAQQPRTPNCSEVENHYFLAIIILGFATYVFLNWLSFIGGRRQ